MKSTGIPPMRRTATDRAPRWTHATRRTRAARLACVLLALATTTPLSAQASRPLRFTVAVGPASAVIGVASLEAEARVGTRGLSVGVGGSYDPDPDYMSWVQAKAKYALRGTALRGAAIGVTAGVTRLNEQALDECGETAPGVVSCPLTREVVPMLGVVFDWNWYPGAHDRLLLGAGLGGSMLFGARSAVDALQPDGRLVIGISF